MPEEVIPEIVPVDPTPITKRVRATAETPSIKALQTQIKNLQAQLEVEYHNGNIYREQTAEAQKALARSEARCDFLTQRNKAVLGNLSVQLEALEHSIKIELQTEVSNVR